MSSTSMLDATFGALADSTRRAILVRLAQGEATVNELARPFGLALPTISKHLAVLERARLIEKKREANRRLCRMRPETLNQASEWIAKYTSFWMSTLDSLDEFAGRDVNREQRQARRSRSRR